MPLTDDEIQQLEFMAYACDSDMTGYFDRTVAPWASTAPVGQLYALCGFLINHGCPDRAEALADYARRVWGMDGVRPDARTFFANFNSRRVDAHSLMSRSGPPF
jgi:hypothetical protein